jgi:cytoskeletal protein RodZ
MKQKVYTNEQKQREQLLALGAMLQQARQSQGTSLDDLAQKTLIRPPLLVAIENADLTELPEPVYVRGLIRRYAEALGLDGETLASQYFTRPTLTHNRGSWKQSPAAQLRPLHLYGAYVLLIAASVSGLSFFLKQTTPATTAPPILDPEAVEQLMPKQRPVTRKPVVAQEQDPPVVDSPIMVEVEFIEQSWIRIVADGSTQFEGILQPGESRAWSADESLTIRAGNAGGVLVSYNQGERQAMGQLGTVAEQTFRPHETISMGLN